jgi:hypothetical protein
VYEGTCAYGPHVYYGGLFSLVRCTTIRTRTERNRISPAIE